MRQFILITSVIILLVSCKSAQKYFDDGNFEKAYTSALKEMKKGNKDRKNRNILNTSFDALINQNRSETSSAMTSNILEDWEYVYHENKELINYYNEGKSYLKNDVDPAMASIVEETDTLRADIVKNFMELAYLQMDTYDATGDKISAQEAHWITEKLMADYDQTTPEVMTLSEEAKQAGTIHILVNTESRNIYKYDIDRQFDRITRESSDYVEVHFNTMLSDEDCVLNIDFGSLDQYARDRDRVERFREEVRDGYTTEIDTAGNEVRVPRYITVEGEVLITERRTEYNWEIRVRVDDPNNFCDFRSRRFNISDESLDEFYQVSGDSRAIPTQYQDRNRRLSDRDQEDILEDLIRDAYDEIRRYYF